MIDKDNCYMKQGIKRSLLLLLKLLFLLTVLVSQSPALNPEPTLESAIERVKEMEEQGYTRKAIADFVVRTVADRLTFLNHSEPKRDGRAVPNEALKKMLDLFNTWRDRGEMVDAAYSSAIWAWENRMGQCNESAFTAFHILAMAYESTDTLSILNKGDHNFVIWGDIKQLPDTFSPDDLRKLDNSYVIDPWDNKSFLTKKLDWYKHWYQHGKGRKVAIMSYRFYIRQYKAWLDKCHASPDAYQKWLLGKGRSGKYSKSIRESILIVLDASGSMSSNRRIEKARDAARRVLQGITPEGDTEVGLITFSGCGHVKIVAEFTTDPKKIIAILPQIRPSGGTPLAEATAEGKKYLREKSRGVKKRFILLTDGKESCNGDPVAEMRK